MKQRGFMTARFALEFTVAGSMLVMGILAGRLCVGLCRLENENLKTAKNAQK